MKNNRIERLYRVARAYHRSNPWRLDQGLFIPHAYPEEKELSWWDDVGFILNRRRVMIWWVHPRMKYAEAIEDMAFKEAGEFPSGPEGFPVPGEKMWLRVGRSRKKVVGQRSYPLLEIERTYLDDATMIGDRLRSEGIDLVICPSMSIQTLSWCTGVELCIPIEVRNNDELRALAILAKRLIKRETTITEMFPNHKYDRSDWLREAEKRSHR